MREKAAVLGGIYGKRYTAKQKNRFISYLNQQLNRLGYETRLDVEKGETGRVCKNLYAGDLEKAKVIVTVSYDTPSRFFFPGYIYRPLNSKNTLHREMMYQALQSAAAVSLLVIYYIFIFQPSQATGNTGVIIPGILGLIILAAGTYRAAAGTANPYNFARNTTGIALLMEIMKKLGKRSRIAYAFLDQACCSKEGYIQLAQELGERKKSIRIVMLECVGAGEKLHFIAREQINVDQEGLQVHIAGEKDIQETVLNLFPQGVLLAGGEWEHGELIIRNTRTKRDSEFCEEKLDYTMIFLSQYLERLVR